MYVDGELAGIYKGQTPQNLENAAKYYLGEAGISGNVEVKPVAKEEPAPTAADAAAAATPEAAHPTQEQPQTAPPEGPTGAEMPATAQAIAPPPQSSQDRAGVAEAETSAIEPSAEPASAGSGPQG